MAEISLEKLSKVFPDGTTAVADLDLVIADGEFVVLVGPSGCGKTTALRMVAGLEEPTSGEIRIGGRSGDQRPAEESRHRHGLSGLRPIPADDGVRQHGIRAQAAKDAEGRHPRSRPQGRGGSSISREPARSAPSRALGRQRQRVAMGRAIVREPRAFLLDEPLSNLDAKLRVQMRAEISRIQRNLGVTTIYVTHDQTEAMTMGNRVAVMKQGCSSR